ncbi:MAG: hypothetical protein K0S32_4501 [Bacteroidetes bacterium]|nr:hypothetical protein [Bacteroidota bacterium]
MNKKGIFKYYPQAFAVLIIAYVAFRIFNVDITNDEAYSFHNVKKFWYAEFLCTGNSHWFNSLWMWVCTIIGLEEVFFLRLFSFLSFLVFVFLVLRFSKSLNEHYLKLFALCTLLLNPFMLDYFVLARGYASGLMLEMLSIMLFFKNVDKGERKLQFYSLLFACLSAIANYSFVYYLIPFAVIYFIRFYAYQEKKFYLRKIFYVDGSVLAFTILIVFMAIRFITKCSNDYVGAGTGSDFTSTSFVTGFLYLKEWDNSWPMRIFPHLFNFVSLSAVVFGFSFYRRLHNNPRLFYISILFFSMFLLVFLAEKLPNGVYPEGRSALFLWPIATMMVLLAVNEIIHPSKPYLIYAISILLLINFYLRMNSDYTVDFKAQSGSKNLFKYLESKGARTVALPGELNGVYVNYYQMKSKREFNFQSTPISNHTGSVWKNRSFPDYIVLYPPYKQLKSMSYLSPKRVEIIQPNNLIVIEL